MSGAYPSGATPLRGRYLVRNRALYAMLRASDAALEIVRRPVRGDIAPPRRLLIGVGGHLGDAVIATSILPVLVRHFPGIELGMVLPSWSEPVVAGHSSLQWIHTVDHWRTNRAAGGMSAKWRRYRRTRRTSIDEIRAVGYDAAIDLYPFFPNMAGIFWRAGVPVRIGYRSGGHGSLYTHAVDWRDSRLHTSAQHLQLLSELDPTISARFGAGSLRYDLPALPAPGEAASGSALTGGGSDFVVIHPGVGDERKAWPTPRWRELVERLAADGQRLVFTGAGAAELQLTRQLADGISGATDLCGQLDWPTFRGVLARARLAIGSDSVAMHVAAAHGTPCVSIMAAMSDPMHWRPLGDRVEIVTRGVSCAPCFQSKGCPPMTCVRGVTVNEVLDAANRLMASVGTVAR